ncbi:TPA_asm: P6 [Erysimum trirhavirus 1]|nr:TPA_asm: P6 [Erysimum trirhavirus 1]
MLGVYIQNSRQPKINKFPLSTRWHRKIDSFYYLGSFYCLKSDLDLQINTWFSLNMNKLPEVPNVDMVHEADPNASQSQIFAAFSSPMMNDAVADSKEESENHPQEFKLEDIMIEPETKVHTRPKVSIQEAKQLIDRGLQINGLSLDSGLLDSLARHTKGAIISEGEFEIMAMTLRACHEDYALSSLKNSIEQLTNQIKSMTSEMDDAMKRIKGVNQALNQNNELINLQANALKNQTEVKAVGTAIPRPVTHEEQARAMLEGLIDLSNQNSQIVIRIFAKYLELKNPHMSISTFKAMSRDARIEILQSAMATCKDAI